jgi:AcrR family transcriptional regulator
MSQTPTLVHSTPEPQGKGGRARKRAETRERLFEAALKEFREYGFAGAQIDRIAKAAGVVRGTFYFHFPSKDDVLLELAHRINARIARRIEALGDSSTSLRDLLRRVNDAISDEHTRVGEAGLQAELLSLYTRRPQDLNALAGQNAPDVPEELEDRLALIETQSGFKMSMPKDLVAIVFMTSLFGIYVRIPPSENRRVACEALIDLFVRGLQSGAPTDAMDGLSSSSPISATGEIGEQA